MRSLNHIELLGSEINFQSNTLESLPKKTILITEENLFKIYKSKLSHFNLIVIKEGEANKNLTQVEQIIHSLLKLSVDRSSELVAFGGGVLLDIAAFAASIFLRGVNITLIPTSLLAMVDASVGGKNGVNFEAYKNIVGVIKQPKKVIIDPEFLQTLPKEELINGYAELIKTFLIKDKALVKQISNYTINSINSEILDEFILKSVQIKAEIVRQDEKESGLRKVLNFGHTFGHAIERESKLPHGQAVAIGMKIAARFSNKLGYLNETDYKQIIEILASFELPTNEIINEAVLNSLQKDKKRRSEEIDFILLDGIGNAIIKPMSISQIRELTQ